MDWFKAKILDVKMIDDMMIPTQSQIQDLASYTDLSVSTQSTSDWYCLLRRTQGSIITTLEAGYSLQMDDDQEYNYIIDVDKNSFSVKEYLNTFTLTEIPDNWVDMLESNEDNN